MLERKIIISIPGQSEFNRTLRIGGNSALTHDGEMYACELYRNLQHEKKLQVWTSQMKSTIETSRYFSNTQSFKQLNKLDVGVLDGYTCQQIQDKFPQEFNQRLENKYTYKYPSGESYVCVMKRLQPILEQISNIEQSQSVLIICDLSIARILLQQLIECPNDQFVLFVRCVTLVYSDTHQKYIVQSRL